MITINEPVPEEKPTFTLKQILKRGGVYLEVGGPNRVFTCKNGGVSGGNHLMVFRFGPDTIQIIEPKHYSPSWENATFVQDNTTITLK